MQLSKLQQFKLELIRFFVIGILQIGGIMSIQILWFMNDIIVSNSDNKYDLFVFILFCLSGLMLIIFICITLYSKSSLLTANIMNYIINNYYIIYTK